MIPKGGFFVLGMSKRKEMHSITCHLSRRHSRCCHGPFHGLSQTLPPVLRRLFRPSSLGVARGVWYGVLPDLFAVPREHGCPTRLCPHINGNHDL